MADPIIYEEQARLAFWSAQPDSSPRGDLQIVLSEELECIASFIEDLASADIERDPDATRELVGALQRAIAAHVPDGADRVAAFVRGQFNAD